nr:CbiX/SirB N-terminal domain-containing protein [Diaminobutyricimonas aerilata]
MATPTPSHVPAAPQARADLLAISHGTSSEAGQAAIAALVDAVAERARGVRVRPGFVDVQRPDVPDVLAEVDQGATAVIVPLLLSAGYHVHVDLARAARRSPVPTLVAAALGPDRRLVDVLEQRLAQSGRDEGDGVVLAAAGSSDERSVRDCERMAVSLAARLGCRVDVGFVSAAVPPLAEAIDAARAASRSGRVVVATYLLAPGYFAGLVEAGDADVVTAPLLDGGPPPPALVDLVIDRFAAAAGGR